MVSPTCKIVWDQSRSLLDGRHPLNHHIVLCPEALNKTKEIWDGFDTTTFVAALAGLATWKH